METLTPVSVIQPEVAEAATNEAPVLLHPLARGIIGTAVGLAVDLGREVLRPELASQQQVRQPARNQQELLCPLPE